MPRKLVALKEKCSSGNFKNNTVAFAIAPLFPSGPQYTTEN